MMRLNLQQFASADYWRKREERNLKSNLKQEAEYDKEIERIYKDMLDSVQKEIDAFYGKYAKTEGITLAEAKKRVSQLDIEAYERKAKKYVDAASKGKDDVAFSKQANEEMRIYNLTMKVNRLEMLKANIGLELIKGHAELETFMGKILKGRTEAELKRQAGILGETIIGNAKMADTIVNASFKNAKFSDRIWMYHDQMKADLSKLLQSGMIQGKNSRQLAKDLRKYYYGPEYLKNGKKGAVYNTERLMRTELARVQTEAQKQMFDKNGFTEYTFLALADCCDICAAINGKHFKVKDLMPGDNAPPMHPWCRCSISAYEDSEEYEAWLDFLDKGGTTAEWNKFGKAAWKESGIINPIPNNKSQELTNRRKERLAARKSASEVKNKYGQTITFDKSLDGEGWKQSINLIKQLVNEYNTRLLSVKVGAHQAAGTVNLGGEMRLSSKNAHTAIHEFAHSISIESLTKFGVEQHEEFWKEIKKIRQQYRKDVGDDSTRWISSYEHGNRSADEFLAEAFTHAKLKQLGLEIPSKYGVDFTYSDKVLAVVDKYFKKASGNNLKEIANSGGSSRIKSIDIDDFEVVTYGKNIDEDVKKTIFTIFKQAEKNGELFISEVVVKDIPSGESGTPVLQIEPTAFGTAVLNINASAIAGKTIQEVNKKFEKSRLSITNTLEEAVKHECGHAKLIKGMSIESIDELYRELEKVHIDGISSIAYKDGAECIAEVEVLLFRGDEVPEEAMKLYKKYIKE